MHARDELNAPSECVACRTARDAVSPSSRAAALGSAVRGRTPAADARALAGSGGSRRVLRQLQRRHGNRYAQRVLAAAERPGERAVAPPVEGAIERERGRGQPLDAGVAGRLEQAFGRSFGDVRIHTDQAADTLTRSLEARAFTVGRDIFFRPGAYGVDTTARRELLAHELTHVVQQTDGAKLVVADPADRHEREAEQAAGFVARWEREGSQSHVLHRELARERPSPASAGGADRVDRQPWSPGARAAVGALTGALVGALVGFAVGSIPGAIVGALVGAGVGAAAGALTASPLTYTTVTAARDNGCGGYEWAVRWRLQGPGASTANGFVVQKLQFDLKRERCNGTRNDFAKTYWEAWQVRNGAIFVGTSASPHNADTFRVPPTPGHKGANVERGWARFIPNYTAPLAWGNVPEAGSLPATTAQPAGWSDSGTLAREIRSEFDCCTQPPKSTLTTRG